MEKWRAVYMMSSWITIWREQLQANSYVLLKLVSQSISLTRFSLVRHPMCGVGALLFNIYLIANSFSILAADDLQNANENRWVEMLRAQTPQVSESRQRTAIAMTVAALAQSGRETEAKDIALQQIDDDTKNSLLTSVIDSLSQRSLFDKALSVASEISEPVWKERATHFVAMALAKVGELERAEKLVEAMSDAYHKERIDIEVCEYLARKGNFEDALTRSSAIADPYRKQVATQLIERIRNGTPSPLEQLSGSLRMRIHTLTAFSSEGTYDAAILAIVAAKAGDHASALKHIQDSIGDTTTTNFPPQKIPIAILASVAFIELGDRKGASELVERLYESADHEWSGLSTAFGTPILMSLLVRLERLDAIDEILKQKRKGFDSDPTEFWYLFTLDSLAESLVEQGRIAEFESRLSLASTPDEKLYLLMGAIIGAEYARQNKP